MATASETVRQIARDDPTLLAIRVGGADISYGALDEAANRIATNLVATCPPRSAIALKAHGSIAVVEAIIGIRRAGMISVPIDPTCPPQRAAEMLLDSGAQLLIVEAASDWHDIESTEAPCPVVILGDVLAAPGEPDHPDVPLALDDLQVLSYTSGSTGTPKAVMRGELITPAIEGIIERYMPPTMRVWAALSAGSLSASTIILMLGIAAGKTVLPIEVRSVGLTTLADLIDEEQVDVLALVPTVLRFWLPGLEPDRSFPSLKVVAAFGEALTGEDHNAMRARVSPDAIIFNAYASNESGMATALARSASEVADPGPQPVGYPAPDVELKIVDEAGNDAADGVSGEIVVTGHSTALGYWRRPELTKATFTVLPDGRRVVRTGDRGRILPDGALEHTGRIDHVVKISGNRVDLGDIEHALRTLPGVQDAAVSAHVDDAGTTTLHGYIVPLPAQELAHHAVLRSQLARKVPSWMLPLSLTTLPELPRLSGGKVDRNSLPEPDPAMASDSPDADRAPSVRESQLLPLWRQALGTEQIGLNDDFFALGGDSMTAAAIMAELDRRHGIVRPVTTLLEAPTVAALAAAIDADVHQHAIVPVRASGSGEPLIVIHGLQGDPFFTRDIAKYVDAERPVYALRPRLAAHGDRLEDPTVEALAATYVAALLAVQPDGPYRIFGFSAGGPIGYEMTRQLEASGHEVDVLVVGDSQAPGLVRMPEPPVAVPLATRVSRKASEIRSSGVRDGGRLALKLAAREARKQASVVRQRLRPPRGSSPQPVGPETPEARANRMARAVAKTLMNYRPTGRIAARVVLVRANLPGGPDLGWSEFSDNLEIVPVTCDHFDLIHEPFVKELGALIEQAISGQRIGGATSAE